jgi:hypothetical protein
LKRLLRLELRRVEEEEEEWVAKREKRRSDTII